MDIDKKITKLYILGEFENINFLNKNLYACNGSQFRYGNIILIYINLRLKGKEELIVLTHEMGHYYMNSATVFSPPIVKEIDEAHSLNWAATYLVPRDKYIEVMRDKFVNSDFEAAEELGVDIATLQRARRRYELQGLPVSQADLGFVYREP